MDRISLNNGAFLGIALVITALVLYLISPEYYLSAGSGLGIIIGVLLFVKTGMDKRKSLGGFMSYGESFKAIFLCSAVAYAIYAVFEIILYNFIDPTLSEMIKDLAIESLDKFSGFLGDDGYDIAMEEIEKQDYSMGIKNILTSYIGRLIGMGVIINAIISIFTRKNRPDFA